MMEIRTGDSNTKTAALREQLWLKGKGQLEQARGLRAGQILSYPIKDSSIQSGFYRSFPNSASMNPVFSNEKHSLLLLPGHVK